PYAHTAIANRCNHRSASDADAYSEIRGAHTGSVVPKGRIGGDEDTGEAGRKTDQSAAERRRVAGTQPEPLPMLRSLSEPACQPRSKRSKASKIISPMLWRRHNVCCEPRSYSGTNPVLVNVESMYSASSRVTP